MIFWAESMIYVLIKCFCFVLFVKDLHSSNSINIFVCLWLIASSGKDCTWQNAAVQASHWSSRGERICQQALCLPSGWNACGSQQGITIAIICLRILFGFFSDLYLHLLCRFIPVMWQKTALMELSWNLVSWDILLKRHNLQAIINRRFSTTKRYKTREKYIYDIRHSSEGSWWIWLAE